MDVFRIGTCWIPEEGAAGLCGPDPDLRPAASVHREEPDGGEGGHFYQSGRRHPGDQECHELRLKSGHHLLRMRQQGSPSNSLPFLSLSFFHH